MGKIKHDSKVSEECGPKRERRKEKQDWNEVLGRIGLELWKGVKKQFDGKKEAMEQSD